jgi:hypothetical protein
MTAPCAWKGSHRCTRTTVATVGSLAFCALHAGRLVRLSLEWMRAAGLAVAVSL